MGFHREQILPRPRDLALRDKEAAQLPARTAGLGGEVAVPSGFDALTPAWGSPLRWICSPFRNTPGAAVEGRIAATCAMSGPGRGGEYDN